MMNKVLYLDIDGVLNTIERQKKNWGKDGYQAYNKMVLEQEQRPMHLDNHTLDHITNLDWKLCYSLYMLIWAYQIDSIVICSSWRKVYKPDQIKLLFIAKGFPQIADRIIGETPFLSEDRAKEIKADIEERGVKEYYILDDDLFDYEKNGFDPKILALPVLNKIAELLDDTLTELAEDVMDVSILELNATNETENKAKLEKIKAICKEKE